MKLVGVQIQIKGVDDNDVSSTLVLTRKLRQNLLIKWSSTKLLR